MSKFICSLLTVGVLIFGSLPVFADEVLLKNGDRITGKIVSRDGENIVLETQYAGAVTIAAGHVEKVTLREPAEPSGGRDEALSAAKPAESAARDLKPVPKLFGGPGFGITNGWSGNANIGFSYTAGNSSTTTLATGIRAVKTGGDDKLTVYFRSLWNRNRDLASNATTSNALWGGARYDRNINDRMFGFAAYDFERDHPKKLNFRSVAGGGIGHHTAKNDRTELDIMLGAAWNRTWQQGDNTDTPEATIGNSLKHRINGRIKIQESFTFFQNFTDKGEFRYMLDTTLSADVTKKIGWFVTVGNRFNNDPIDNSEKNDVLFTTGVKWNFGQKK